MAEQNAVSLDDKSVELSLFERYKGKEDQTDRIVVVSKALLRGNSHWFNNRTFRCLTENPEKPAICCEKLGAPTQKFAMVVFHYTADKAGEITDSTKCQGVLKIWLLTESRYQELSGIHKQWPLLDGGFDRPQHDLLITCTEEQYQRMTIKPTATAHWKSKDTWYNAITQRVEKAKDHLGRSLGKKLPEKDVKEILGLSVPATPPTAAPGDIDLTDILDEKKDPAIE